MRNLQTRAGRKRAIVLITTLAIMTFMLMLAAMLVTTGFNAQRRAAYYFWSSAANEAALAGAVFAQTALQCNLGWMSSPQSTATSSMTYGNMQVTQDFGNQIVQGFIYSQTNNVVSEFRISFNAPSVFPNDGRPAGVVSRNNMLNDVAFSYNNGAMSRVVPKRTAEILVEGVTRAATDGTVLARRVVEVGLYRAPFMPAASSGGTIQVNVDPTAGQWKLQMAAGVTSVPSIRSMGNVELYANDASQFSSTIGSPYLSNTGREFILRDPTTGQSKSTMSAQFVNPADNAQQIALTAVTFDQVKAPTVRGTLPAGTYVYWDSSGSTPAYYKDLSYNPTDTAYRYVFDATDQSVKVVDQQGNMVGSPHVPTGNASQPYSGFWGSSMTVNLAHSVDVEAQTYQQSGSSVTNNNVAILAAPSITNRVNFQFASGQGVALQNSNAGGSITLRGDVSGAGSVVAKGDIVFEGHSALSPNPDAVVTMYSGGSTTLSPILNQVASVDAQTVDVNSASAPAVEPTATPNQLALYAFSQALQAYIANPSARVQGESAAECGLSVVAGIGGSAAINASSVNSELREVVRKNLQANLGEAGYKDVITGILGLPSGTGFNDAQRDSAITQALQSFSSPSAGGMSWTVTQKADGSWILNSPAASSGATTDNQKTPAPTATTQATTTASVPDQEFRGLIYACKNFTTRLPATANVSLQGAIVAYGGDPTRTFNVNDTTTWPGYDGTGQMVFSGKNVTFTYDPTYLGGLYSLYPAGSLSRSFFASF